LAQKRIQKTIETLSRLRMKKFLSATPSPEEIHIWRIKLGGGHAQKLAHALSKEERARAARFAFDLHRDRFIRGRYAMRTILGGYLGIAASDVDIACGPHGKPFLRDSSAQFGFNMTHSADLALLAVGVGRDIGVDLEMLRAPQDMMALAKSVFSDEENNQFESLVDELRVPAFFNCWTRKEALLKAMGTGLSLDAKTIHIGLDVEKKSFVPPLAYGHTYGDAPIEVMTIAQDKNYVASLAVAGGFHSIMNIDFTFEDASHIVLSST
jgi:4'-phosphopantetheinyl transferase